MKPKIFVIGSFNVDLIAYVDEFPLAGQTLNANSNHIGCGGKGTNQALAIAQHNVDVRFITKVGQDHFASMAKQQLSKWQNLTPIILQDPQAHTGMANIVVRERDSENTIVLNLGANLTITREDIDVHRHSIEQASILVVQLENNLDAIEYAIQIAKQAGVKILLNPAPFRKEMVPLLPYVDILTPNETELNSLHSYDMTDPQNCRCAIKQLTHSTGISSVVLTQGAKGSLVYQDGSFQQIPAVSASPVDTTGAGDSFTGALAVKLAMQESIITAAQYANVYASLKVEKQGASNMPSAIEAEKKLAQITTA